MKLITLSPPKIFIWTTTFTLFFR